MNLATTSVDEYRKTLRGLHWLAVFAGAAVFVAAMPTPVLASPPMSVTLTEDGDLLITGTDGDDTVVIAEDSETGTLCVIVAASDGSTFNKFVTGVGGNVWIKLGAGDDTAQIDPPWVGALTDTRFPGNLIIDTGTGNDTVTLDGADIAGNLEIWSDADVDDFSVVNSTVGGQTFVNGVRDSTQLFAVAADIEPNQTLLNVVSSDPDLVDPPWIAPTNSGDGPSSAPTQSVTAGAAFSGTVAQAATIDQILQASDYDQVEHGEILRLYLAIFNREPDVSGAKYWISDVYEGLGESILEVTSFIATDDQPEFAAAYSDVSTDEAFITRIYSNMLEREPDDGGRAYWLLEMNNGLSRSNAARFIALSPEFVNAHPYRSPTRT